MYRLSFFPIILSLLTVITLNANAQDIGNVKRIVKELASESYHGRCYTNGGADKAAEFIQKEFKNIGLTALKGKWFQPFNFKLNQIKEVKLSVDGNNLKPGIDYVVRRNSPTIKGDWKIKYISKEYLQNPDKMTKLVNDDNSKQIMVVDLEDLQYNYEEYDSASKILFRSNINKYILLHDKELQDFVGYGRRPSDRLIINIQKKAFPLTSKSIQFRLKTEFDDITTKNVMAYLPGKIYKDSIIIVCGHYDHLGQMGPEAYFPGADDNASAIGAMVELSDYMINENYPDKSILFVAFSGEEAGLLGSGHFVEHLPVEKKMINYVLNLDMVGFGETGLHIWNGTNEIRLTEKIKRINQKHNLLDTLIVENNTPNSDHYSFTKKNINAIFLTTGLDPSVYYHTVFDSYNNTTFLKTREIIQLVCKLINSN